MARNGVKIIQLSLTLAAYLTCLSTLEAQSIRSAQKNIFEEPHHKIDNDPLVWNKINIAGRPRPVRDNSRVPCFVFWAAVLQIGPRHIA